MCTSAATIFFFVLFLLILHQTTAQKKCSDHYCRKSYIPVRFPFHLQGDGHSPSCGFPGFNLICSSAFGGTVLKLPNSGEFIVRDIDYLNHQIVLDDPRNCLAERRLELNLTGTPFISSHYESYTLVDCPSNLSFDAILTSNIVPCLSNATNTVVVVTTNDDYANSLSLSCKLRGTYRVPISERPYYAQATARDLSRDLELSWNAPNCRDCEITRGVCGFRNSTTQEIGCFYDSSESWETNGAMLRLVCFAIVIPAAICVLAAGFCVGCANREEGTERSNTETTQHSNMASVSQEPPILPIGFDDSTIQSFAKVVVGESRRVTGPNHNICIICLSEYLPKDILRCIPECKHCFHADCVDEWLRINSSCPICRNSSASFPAQSP